MKDSELKIKERYTAMASSFDERSRRAFLAGEAKAFGRGGIAAVVRATGASPNTVARGLVEAKAAATPADGRVRRVGGDRKKVEDKDPMVLDALDALVQPATRGDPESALRWTSKSTRRLAAELRMAGLKISHHTVERLLKDGGYSLQAKAKVIKGGKHPDRDAQFAQIDAKARAMQARGCGVRKLWRVRERHPAGWARQGSARFVARPRPARVG